MKTSLAAILLVMLSFPLTAQSRGRTQAAPAPVRTDLMSMLLELDRASAATLTDISHLHIDRWKGGWRSGFTTSSAHKHNAEQAAGSLQRNLKGPLPDMIRDALNSRGSLAPTFKVYEDLNLVCETLGTLVAAAEQYGNKKEEYEPLAIDFTALTRLRRGISSYIVQRATATDSGGIGGGSAGLTNFSEPFNATGDMPRKIIIDDEAPAQKKPVAKKKAPPQYSQY